jgi:hypothetical protein
MGLNIYFYNKRGEVVDIGVDYIEIYEEITKESFFVYKSEQVLYLFT